MMLMHGSLKIMTRQDSLHNFILSLLPCRGLRKMVFTGEPPSKIATCRTAQAEQGPVLKYVKLTENASAPTRGSPLAAGFDLKSAYDYTVMPHSRELIKTDLQISMPAGCYARIAPRSGLAVKHFIDVGAGVVDADYTGNICVVLFNFGKDEFKVNKGDRIAQLILEKIIMADLEECSSIGETERGSGGFGSTGTC